MPKAYLHVHARIGLREGVPQKGDLEFERGDGDVVLLEITGHIYVPRNSERRRDVS